MARTTHRISPRAFATLKEPGFHSDGMGLYLAIDQAGARRWAFVFQWNSKRREMGLGGAGKVGLAKARELAQEAREQVSAGVDPIAARKALAVEAAKNSRPSTFASVAASYIRAQRRGWKNRKHAKQWPSTLRKYAKHLRPKLVADITADDILTVLRPIWFSHPETASRVRGRIERILDAGKARGLRTGENPARWRGHLDLMLSAPKKLSRGHHKALPYADLPHFLAKLRERQATAAIALELTILTASRTNEVIAGDWREVDVKAALWIIPPERMKSGREHRVPLSDRAVELITMLQQRSDRGYILPGARGKHMSNMAMAKLLGRMGVDATPHGFRSTFRDWVNECTNFQGEIAEAALAHVIGDATERAYRRGDALEKRRALMDAWALFCTATPGANVLPFPAQA